MNYLNFISFYTYFDSLEVKLRNELLLLQSKSIDKFTDDDLLEVFKLRLQLKFLRKIYIELSQYLIDL